MTTQSNSTEPETAIDGQDVATVEELTQWADQVEGERDAMIETIAELERERDALQEALQPFAALDVDAFAHFQNKPDGTEVYTMNASTITLGDIRRARAALGETR